MREPMTVDGLFETHLPVGDLDRSVRFYCEVVGLPLAFRDSGLGVAFFWIGGARKAMLGLWAAGPAPLAMSLHVAFRTSLENVLRATDRLRERGVTPLSFSARETDEPSVIGWMPAAAIYFRDPDGHLLEYLALLDDRPDPERGVTTWSEWRARRADGRRRPAPAAPVVACIRDAVPEEAVALELLHRRSADVREGERAHLAADAHALVPPSAAIAEGRVRVALDSSRRRLGFSVIGPVRNGRCELDDLFVEPRWMRLGVGRCLVDDAAARAAAAGARHLDVIADPHALGFYERLGFRVGGEASTRVGRGARMSLDLSSSNRSAPANVPRNANRQGREA